MSVVRGGPPPIRSQGGNQVIPLPHARGTQHRRQPLWKQISSCVATRKASPFQTAFAQLTAVSVIVSAVTFSWGVLWVDKQSTLTSSKLSKDIGNATYGVLYWILVLSLLSQLFSIDFPFLTRLGSIRMLHALGMGVAVTGYVLRVIYPNCAHVSLIALSTTYITTGWTFLVGFKLLAVHTSRTTPQAIPAQQPGWLFFVLLASSNLCYVGIHFQIPAPFIVLPLGIAVVCGFLAAFYALWKANKGQMPPKQIDMVILVYCSMHICPLLIRLSDAMLLWLGNEQAIWVIFLYRLLLSLGTVCVDDLVDIMTGEFALILGYHVRLAEALASTAAKVNKITSGYDALIYNAIDMVITAVRDGGITEDIRFYLKHKIWFFSRVVRSGRSSKIQEAHIKALRSDLKYQIARSEHNMIARISANASVLVCYCLALIYKHTIPSIVRVEGDHIVPMGILIGGLIDVWISRHFADRLLKWKANVLERLERGVFRKTVEKTAAGEAGSSAGILSSQGSLAPVSLQGSSQVGSHPSMASVSGATASPSQAQAISMSESISTQLSVPLVKVHRDSSGKGAGGSHAKKSTATSRVGLRQGGFPQRDGYRETVLLSTAFVATAFFGMWST